MTRINLLEMLNGHDQATEHEQRYGRNRNVKNYAFLRAGLPFFIAFDLFFKAIEHSQL